MPEKPMHESASSSVIKRPANEFGRAKGQRQQDHNWHDHKSSYHAAQPETLPGRALQPQMSPLDGGGEEQPECRQQAGKANAERDKNTEDSRNISHFFVLSE